MRRSPFRCVPTYLVAGLGNPGKAYERSRHNVGFMLMDRFARQQGASFRELNGAATALVNDILLCKPMRYMNLSGYAVSRLVHQHKVGAFGLSPLFWVTQSKKDRDRVQAVGGGG
jgi:PTH1 family peptidyl-tRNA hydrolase